jgi:hypothetical protein
MVNRETLTPSGSDAILKRHLFSGVAKNWIKGGGNVGRVYFVRRPSRQSFGFRVAASSGPIPKAPGSAGGYLPLRRFMPSVYAEAYIEIQFRAREAMSFVHVIRGCPPLGEERKS